MKKLILLLLLALPASAQTIPHYVTLTWNWTGTGTATFNVYRGTTSGGETLLAGGVIPMNYTDNTAVVGTKYFYTVTATVGGVESSPSTEVAAQIIVPPAPTNPATAIH